MSSEHCKMLYEQRHEKKGFLYIRKQRSRSASRLCFRFTERTIPLLSESKISKPLAIFTDCTARFVADLVGNPEDQVSHNITCILKKPYKITCFMAQGNRTLLPIKSERCHEKTCFGGKIRISLLNYRK